LRNIGCERANPCPARRATFLRNDRSNFMSY
jgi:hypothetical protein